jgi:hypothetical protein
MERDDSLFAFAGVRPLLRRDPNSMAATMNPTPAILTTRPAIMPVLRPEPVCPRLL